MRVLIYGAAGWIGQQFLRRTEHTVVVGETRPDGYEAAVAPDFVCSFLGRTPGPDPQRGWTIT